MSFQVSPPLVLRYRRLASELASNEQQMYRMSRATPAHRNLEGLTWLSLITSFTTLGRAVPFVVCVMTVFWSSPSHCQGRSGAALTTCCIIARLNEQAKLLPQTVAIVRVPLNVSNRKHAFCIPSIVATASSRASNTGP